MSYQLIVEDKLKRKFLKLKKKDPLHSKILKDKINYILEEPYKFKPLRSEMAGIRRVHVGKSFVLTYAINENKKTSSFIGLQSPR